MKKNITPIVIALTVALLDFIVKKIIESSVQPYDVIHVLPFLNIVNVKNTGAAFGILSTMSNKIFVAVSFLAIFFIIVYISKTSSRLEKISLSLVLGGALGNLIDRLTIGKVIDFIDFFIGSWHWPAFNVADSALTIGIILFLFANIGFRRHKQEKS
ncbi:MAG: signal peptidase II [Nitrospiraceae bacterium]|nr:MAG: signal peptidase II [Nitrospiraceae bacterium]